MPDGCISGEAKRKVANYSFNLNPCLEQLCFNRGWPTNASVTDTLATVQKIICISSSNLNLNFFFSLINNRCAMTRGIFEGYHWQLTDKCRRLSLRDLGRENFVLVEVFEGEMFEISSFTKFRSCGILNLRGFKYLVLWNFETWYLWDFLSWKFWNCQPLKFRNFRILIFIPEQ